jgi:hypothetical protein
MALICSNMVFGLYVLCAVVKRYIVTLRLTNIRKNPLF